MKTAPKPTATVILEKRYPAKKTDNREVDRYPVKLRVTAPDFERGEGKYHSRYYILKYPAMNEAALIGKEGTTIYMTADDWKGAKKNNPWKNIFSEMEKRASGEISKLKPFTFEAFEEKYFDKPKDDQDVFAAITTKATALRKEAKFNTADILGGLLTSLKDFTGREKYPFGNITPTKLKEFETWLLAPRVVKAGKKERIKQSTKTTVSIYIRALQAVFNESATKGIVYPFSKKKNDKMYKIPKWNHNKRALTQADVAKIAGYKADDDTMLQRSRDLWLFSFLCNGINFKDMANLKYSNIHDDTIVFERAKTLKDAGEDNQITVVITRQIGRIIDRWGVVPKSHDRYIFPVLDNGMTPELQHLAVKQMVRNTNKYIKRICTDLEIPLATTYTARHSFATVLKRSGASVEFISESLGHKDIATTQNYLSHFEIDEKRKWAGVLLPDNDN